MAQMPLSLTQLSANYLDTLNFQLQFLQLQLSGAIFVMKMFKTYCGCRFSNYW